MKINKIELFNIGPYEGKNVFDITGQRKKGKITIIGGKNGAGKTTLFSSIKIGLYGYREAGYQGINGFYKRSIRRLINDKVKLESSCDAYVLLDIEIFNGQDWDLYSLKRAWNLNAENFETFTVAKNGTLLTNEEIGDFDNYLLNLIPPELFDLYFFDGEQIADFFLKDESGDRIKTAFMTICGYDTFDLMYKNFKRLSKNTEENDSALDSFFSADESLRIASTNLNNCERELTKLSEEIDLIETELASLDKKYTASGGVSLDEWKQNFINLKTEEKFREEANLWLKNAANDSIPYIILHEEISELLQQMEIERDLERQNILMDALDSLIPNILEEVASSTPGFTKSTMRIVKEKIAEHIKSNSTTGKSILNLSKEEYSLLLQQAAQLRGYQKEEIINKRKEIKKSLNRSQKNRKNLETSNINEIDSYLKRKNELIENKKTSLEFREALLSEHKELQTEEEKARYQYKIAEKSLEKQLKDESINDLTARSIRFLDVLQKRLFRSEISKVEQLFMNKMHQLMRKQQFINKIIIDDDFTLHVYHYVVQNSSTICERINLLKPDGYEKEYGKVHCDDLLQSTRCRTIDEFYMKYRNKSVEINTLIEFDKTIMSKGEKQVFIMALYWSIMELCNKEVPFIIDTPFARIDTTHRAHITKYFFKELKGQILIFSTDEEITDEHIKVIGRDLQSKFMIENIDNKKTTITPGIYFGE